MQIHRSFLQVSFTLDAKETYGSGAIDVEAHEEIADILAKIIVRGRR